MLWVPDVVAGAVAAARMVETEEWLEPMAHLVYDLDVKLR